MRVLFSAGESSGDSYGAVVASELKRLRPTDLSLKGLGGKKMADAGVELLADSSSWGAISIIQALRVVPRAIFGYQRLKYELGKGKPGVFVPIDFGWVNIRLAKAAKRLGWKVLYLVPPGSWRRDKQGKDLPALTDVIVTPFPWSAEMLNAMGANAHFFGHPIRQLHAMSATDAPGQSGLVALPGSRVGELEQLVPLFAETLKDWPGPVRFPVGQVGKMFLVKQWERLSGRSKDAFVDSSPPGAMQACLKGADLALVCSGTATLEVALAKVPMVVTYQASKSTLLEIKLLRIKRPKWVALPNILLDRDVVPELILENATAEKLSEMLQRLSTDQELREQQLRDFEELEALLGPSDALTKTAEMILTWV